jgi:hypothetical protein
MSVMPHLLGEDESSRVASLALKAFHQKHGISKSFGVITDHYDEIRDAFYEHVYYDIARRKSVRHSLRSKMACCLPILLHGGKTSYIAIWLSVMVMTFTHC